jgi:cell wall-associated NlpC family hydrolase
MAGNEFKYIIKTDLQLNAGSINKLLNEVKEVDKQIKQHFDNAKTGGIKVPLSVSADITKLQGEVKRTIEGYQKGQVPSIRIPVTIDEGSIRKLQARISELKKQINSLAEDNKTISVNTSLKVGAGEKEEIQKQIGGTKATINVGLRLNEQDMKIIKAQVESIKAEVKATVTANDHANGDRRFGRADRTTSVNGTVANANKTLRVRRDNADRFIAERKAISDEIRSIKENQKLLNTELKEVQSKEELEAKIKAISESQSKGKSYYHPLDENNKQVKGARVYSKDFDSTIADLKDALKKIDEVASLKKELEQKESQLTEIERKATYGRKNYSSLRENHPLAQLNAQLESEKQAEKAKQDAIAKAESDKQKEAEKARKKIQADAEKSRAKEERETIAWNRKVESEDRRQESKKYTRQRKIEAQPQVIQQRTVNSAHTSAVREDRKIEYRNQPTAVDKYADASQKQFRLEDRLGSLISAISGDGTMTGSQKRAMYSPQALKYITDMINDLRGKIDQVKAERKELENEIQKLGRTDSKYRRSLNSNHQDPTETVANTIRNNNRQSWNRNVDSYNDRIAQQNAINSGRITDPNLAHQMALEDNINRGRIQDPNRAQLEASRINNIRNRYAQRTQNAYDFDNGIMRFGANREYSAVDLEAKLRNPNVSLDESLDILHNQIIPANRQTAKNSNQNFQRAYNINYTDANNQVHSMRTLTYEFTRNGEAVERGDKSLKSMFGTMARNTLVYSVMGGGMYLVTSAIQNAVQQMTDFESKLANIQMITSNLNTGKVSDFFSSFGAGENTVKSNVSNDAFGIGEKYGVSTADTVMPIESMVMARKNLFTDANGKGDPKMQKEIVDKIMQFSAVSTGGNATSEEVNGISQDVLSLYQAMYTQGDPKAHMKGMSGLLDHMAILKGSGVNTNAVADALSELAPDTIGKGIDPKVVASMLGSYNLSDTDSTGANLTQVAKVFFGALDHPDNSKVSEGLLKMGIDTSKKSYSTKELMDAVMKQFPNLSSQDQDSVAQDLAGINGKSPAMKPKMVKFLQSASYDYNDNKNGFNAQDKKTPDALSKSWNAFSDTLKKNFASLGEQVKQLVQLLGKLGAMDFIGVAIKGLTGLLKAVNSVLMAVDKLGNFFTDNHTFKLPNFPKMAMEIGGVTLAIKGMTLAVNKLMPSLAMLMGDWVGSKLGGRRLGLRQLEGVTVPLAGRAILPSNASQYGGRVLTSPFIPTASANPRITGQATVRAGDQILKDMASYTASDALAYKLAGGASHSPIPQGLRIAEETIPKAKGGFLKGLGNFASDVFMVQSFKNLTSRGLPAVGEATEVTRSTGIISKLGGLFTKLTGPVGVLVTRFGLVASALWVAYEVVKKIHDVNHARQVKRDEKETSNLAKQFKVNEKDKAKGKQFTDNVDEWVKLNNKLRKGSPEAYGEGTNDYSSKEGKRLLSLDDTFKNMGIKYFAHLGKGDIKYKSQNSKGKWEEHTVSTDDKKGMQEFRQAMAGGGKNQNARLQEDWAVNLDGVMKYNEALVETNNATKEINKTMQMLGYNISQVDTKFMGVDSMASVQAKMNAVQGGISDTQANRQKINDKASEIETNKSQLDGTMKDTINKLIGHGVKQSTIDGIQSDYEMQKSAGDTSDIMSKYNEPTTKDIAKWKAPKSKGGEGLNDDEVNQRKDQYAGLKVLVSIINMLSGLTDAGDQVTSSMLQVNQQNEQYKLQMKQLNAQLMVMASGVQVLDAKLSQVQSAVGIGRTIVGMERANTPEQASAQGDLMKATQELLKGYRGQMQLVSSQMNNIASANPKQDFSMDYLYNPGQDGLSSEQQAYKDLLEKQTSIQDSVSSTTADMYDQAQQLKDMVLNSDKYASVWERVQNRTQLVKDANKQIFDSQTDISMVNSLSQMRSAVTGQPYEATRNDKLASIRDTNLDNYDKLSTALKTYSGDADKLSQAYNEINKTMGSEFDNAFIDPLKNLIKNDFTEAGNKILSGANSLNTILTNWSKVQMSSASNPSSVAGQTQAFNNAMAIPGFTGSQGTSTDTRTFAQKEQAYLEQMGYRVGSAGYVQAKRQLETSMSAEELKTEVNKNTVPTTANGDVSDYSKSVNGVLKGRLSGYGSVFVQAGAQYGVDPRLIASIAMQENGGDSNILRNSNNIGNIKATGSSNDFWKGGSFKGYRSYATLTDGIMDLTRLIGKYISSGKNTIPSINATYAEDPVWMNGVASFYSKQTGVSVSQLLGGASVTGNGGGGNTSSTSSGFGKSSYTGDSIVAYLNSLGKSSSFSSRQGLAKQYGISGYTGTASQNTTLLSKLRSSSGTASTSTAGGNGNYSSMDQWFSSVKGDKSKLTYSWGGAHVIEDWTTFLKKGIADCSGLVEQVYRKFAGINLGTTSSAGLYAQNDGGTKVTNKSDLQPGDLVFFGNDAKSIHHVGIYAGDDQMWTIDHKGTPVSKDKISSWGDYLGGKHYANAFGTSGSLTAGQASITDVVKSQINSFITAMQAEAEMHSAPALKETYKNDTALAYGQGNISDIMGTSGRLAVMDRIGQERQNVFQQRYDTVQQLNQLSTARKTYVDQANKALKSGDTTDYNSYKDAIKQVDTLITTLKETNKQLADWDKTLTQTEQLDPRYNHNNSMLYIKGGYDKLNSMDSAGQEWSPDYIKLLGEMATMLSTYDTHAKNTQLVGDVWNNSGQQTTQFIMAKRVSDQDSINLIMDKITKINGVLKNFAQGTQAWYTTLEEAVKVQQELHDLEQQRLQNAQSMFELTGQGIQGYVKQKAYTQSKDYSQSNTDLKTAMSNYKTGTITNGSGISIALGSSDKYAKGLIDILHKQYDVNASTTKGKDGKYYLNTTQNLTKDQAQGIIDTLKKQGHIGNASVTGGSTTKMDDSQQLANLQIISGLHDQMIQQMNDYRSAVVGAFKAGAMSLDEYMKKMNDLRDVQNEAKENAVKMVDALSSGFQDAFSNALSSGMQGNMDSAQSFIDSMKQTMASTISSSLASSLFNNSGLLDVTNGLISKITQAATSGSPTDIANMFNNNDFGQQIQDAMAPFLPLINQIVASTQGMFTIMKNQVFNAPNGFKIDSEVAKVAKANGIGQIRTWDPTGKNGSGSSDSGTGTSTPVVVPPSSSTPSGVPTTTSSGGATSTGAPEGTTGTGSGAPNTSGSTTTPATDGSKVNSPTPPASSSKKGTYITTDNVWDHKTPDANTKSRIKIIKKGTKVNVIGEKSGFLEIGTNQWISAKYAKASASSGGSSSGGSKSSGSTKHVNTSVNFRSSAGYGNNVIGTIPKGSAVTYLGTSSGWAHVKYGSKTGYVGPQFIYHTGGLAGMMNFSSPNGLKPDELQAILRKGEGIFTQKQISSLVGGSNSTHNGGDVNINITVNVEGGQDTGSIKATVETAVNKAMQTMKKDAKLMNLTFKGTSY